MRKLISLCVVTIIFPLCSFAMQKSDSDDWLDENIIVTIEIQQTGQAIQKFSLVTAKKELLLSQIMKWEIDSSSTKPVVIFLEFNGKLDVLAKDKYRLDSRLVLKIPNFILPEDKEFPFVENGWGLGIIVPIGEKMIVIDNTDLKVHLTLSQFDSEKK